MSLILGHGQGQSAVSSIRLVELNISSCSHIHIYLGMPKISRPCMSWYGSPSVFRNLDNLYPQEAYWMSLRHTSVNEDIQNVEAHFDVPFSLLYSDQRQCKFTPSSRFQLSNTGVRHILTALSHFSLQA